MRKIFIICGVCFIVVTMTSVTRLGRNEVGVKQAVEFFEAGATSFAASTAELYESIASIEKNKPASILRAREALKDCRLHYKKIEFFLTYFFQSASLIYNGPPKYEVEEPFMEFQEPIGLQVIESLLFDKNPVAEKEALLQQADAINSSAKDITSLLYGFEANDRQLLESIRLELVRMITLGITGFDAPLLKSGIAEAAASLGAVQSVMQPFLAPDTKYSDSVSYYLSGSLSYLLQHAAFDSFNRMDFLKGYALPLQRYFGLLVTQLNLNLNTASPVLNYDAGDIFDPNALNIDAFGKINRKSDSSLVKLGRALFFEPCLSGNKKISCATCHQPEKYFTDGLAKSVAFDGHSSVRRNAPTLLYSGFQQEQFWDGRAKSLEEQVKDVMNNPDEMRGGPEVVRALLNNHPQYAAMFNAAFPLEADTALLIDKAAQALAAFVKSLRPRNSRFDQHLRSATPVLTSGEINGFNLFMGKAQCATCHFAPLFNGLIPPFYKLSELEVIGTTLTDQPDKPVMDTDSGRFLIFPIGFYDKAFKTPTVRNVSATGPYMHNGAFRTLDAVVEFYNKGGGAGLGLPIGNQTLPSAALNLTKQEVKDLVSFMQSLKDSMDYTNTFKN